MSHHRYNLPHNQSIHTKADDIDTWATVFGYFIFLMVILMAACMVWAASV